MGTNTYGAVGCLLVAVESYLNYGALLILGDTTLRVTGAIGLAGTLFLLAHGIGEAVKGRQTEDPLAAPTFEVFLMAGAAAGLMFSLAVLRAKSLAIGLAAAVAQAGSASTGSATSPFGAAHLPSVSVWLYVLLMLGGFVAALECSRRHGHHLADEADRLERRCEEREGDLNRSLDAEVRAASAKDAATIRWAGAFAEQLERSEELAAGELACQEGYRQQLMLLRGGDAADSPLPEAISSEEPAWTRAPTPAERVGTQHFPKTEPLWPEGFAHNPSNEHVLWAAPHTTGPGIRRCGWSIPILIPKEATRHDHFPPAHITHR